jgi:phenylalanyl-tRNA synthetase beta chain
MKFSENWLRTWVNPSLDGNAFVHKLTMSGLEVEARERLAPNFDYVVVARVLDVTQHPNADRLKVCKVDAGTGEYLQIVCGAPNVVSGAMVPCALVGAKVGDLSIKRANLRGVESSGMLCSAQELGLPSDAAGLHILPQDSPIGADLAAYLDLHDTLTTLKLTPNRGDCLSIAGLAREIGALTGAPVQAPSFSQAAIAMPDARPVDIVDKNACGVYCGRVIRLTNPNAATPLWMKSRLERAGLRPISAVVDVTNYVMMEWGQPLHAFDNDKLTGAVSVRFAVAHESLRLLNQQIVKLDKDMVVIADERGPVALGGVMGGDESSVTNETRSIFLEAAFFPPSAIAGRARRLGLTSDAAYRFERGVDFGITAQALERATQLILDICGGATGPITRVHADIPARPRVLLRLSRVERILGTPIDLATATNVLVSLGCVCTPTSDGLMVKPPSHRFDLALEVDFVEEIARVVGYDEIPAAPQMAKAVLLPQTQSARTIASVTQHFAARDYQEIISYSFVSSELERDFSPNQNPIRIRNPIAEHMGVMRTTLLSGLVQTLKFNLNRQQERVRLFEIGRCFIAGDPSSDSFQITQPRRIGGLSYGNRYEEQWGEKARLVDYFDVKADLEAVFHHSKMRFKKGAKSALHPGRSAMIYMEERAVGYIGELHPQLCQEHDLPSAPIVFEIDLDPILASTVAQFGEVSKLPSVRRDIAVVVDDKISAQQLIDTLYSAAPKAVIAIDLFDQYRGENLGKGKKSLAFRVVMNDTEKTLTEEDIEKIDQLLKQTLVSLHQAQLRS